jgi:hypothetical protein
VTRPEIESIHVAVFDEKGNFREEFDRSLAGVLHEQPEVDFYSLNDAEFHAYLLREFGFQPTVIRVKEFRSSQNLGVRLLPYYAVRENPDELNDVYGGREPADNQPLFLQYWLDGGYFILTWEWAHDVDGRGVALGAPMPALP